MLEITVPASTDTNYNKTDADPFALGRPKTEYKFRKPEAYEDPYGIKTADLNLNYPTKYYKTDQNVDIKEIFELIFAEIMGEVFVPVSGVNDAGVSNSLTYQDPLGDYMEIKNRAVSVGDNTYDMSLLLFGKMHGITRAGVYDYSWNDAWMIKHHPDYAGQMSMDEGWYKGDDPENAETSGQSLPAGCTTTKDAWAAGWVYRLSFKNLTKFVPVSDAPESGLPADLSDQIKSTVYTVYRFDESAANTLQMNPVYGDAVPEGLVKQWEEYYDTNKSYPDDSSMYAKYPGVYRLNDIRIWGEEYGDFVDTEGAITPNPAAYDASLYINVPVAALPAQLAEITLGPDGVTAYKTNLNDKTQSTPLRVFYAVGLSEDLIIRNDSGEQTGVNMGAISEEYKSAHRDGSDIWFISNFYSNTPYEGYVSDDYDYRTRGDPTVSFSPSPENRYYVMQKPLPIYAHAYRVNPKDGSLTPVDCNGGTASYWQGKENIGGNGKTEWETLNGVPQEAGTWDGGLFMGVYKNEEEFKNKYQAAKASGKITDSRGETYQIEEDAIVFFESDLIDHVQAAGDGYTEGSTAFNSDDYFFLLIEYYLPIKDTVGTDAEGKQLNDGSTGGRAVKRAITRKGGEFGSGLHSVNIGNGDMLCWTDMNGHITVGPDYRSYTETGDKLRGEPTFDRLYGTDGGEWWQKVREDFAAELAKAAEDVGGMTEEKFKEYFHWAVAAKPGGVRVGDMFHNRETKSENTTQTASNYYIPTLSTESGVGNDIVLNSYLGNNGRLKIANQTLLTTKLLETPNGALTDEQKNKEFHYQVYIDGMEGTQVAERIKYNPYSKTWQRHIASIDVLTDNSDLLLDSSSKRAFFDMTEEGGRVSARQVVENGEGKLCYADEYGNATDELCTKARDELYNIYLPDNAAGEQSSRRIYNDEEAENYTPLTQSGRIIYVGDAEDESENKTPSPDNLTIFTQATGERPAGTVEYWALNAELIPITDVDRAEQDGGTWSHPDGDTVESYKKLPSLTLYIDRPSEDTSATDVAAAFKTRTMYLTKTLEFGIAVEELYDNIIPSGDRPAFAGMDNAYIAQHTAEYTLKHGEGLLFTGLSDLKNYRFTEKLEDTELAQGYNLKEVSHVQQYGSKTTYRRGFNAFEDLGDIKPPTAEGGEPFYHTNAQIWESYATFRGESDNENLAVNGNHHGPEGSLKNPVCKEGDADETQSDKSVRHYFVRDGELVDKHYKGEQSAFGNNRYVVGATAHFLVNGETQENAAAPLPVEAKTDYAGVYSVFGNTGAYEEQAHFVNEVAQEGSITVLKVTGKGDVLEGAEFTLYELVEASDGKEEKSSVGVQTTRLAYMEKIERDNPSYDKTAQVFTDADGKRRPVHTDEKGELYYFRFLDDGERTAYYDAVKDGEDTFGDKKLECDRVRAVAEFTGLDVSKKYKLEETKIPDGYILTHQPNETFDFRDGEGNPVINIIYEVKNFSPLELPETGRFVTCVITLGALIALVGLYMMRKHRRGYSPNA